MKIFLKILLSVLYPLLLFALLAGFTGTVIGGAAAASMTMGFLVVMLPVFLYAVWNKATTKVKVIQWAAGTVVAFILRLAVSIATDLLFLKTFDLATVSMVRSVAAIGIALITIELARRINARLSRAA